MKTYGIWCFIVWHNSTEVADDAAAAAAFIFFSIDGVNTYL
jgi:hypothetical protein